jgi:hypothetical protein
VLNPYIHSHGSRCCPFLSLCFIEAGGAATVDPFMPEEFPNNRWTPPVGLCPKRKCRARVGVSNYVSLPRAALPQITGHRVNWTQLQA